MDPDPTDLLQQMLLQTIGKQIHSSQNPSNKLSHSQHGSRHTAGMIFQSNDEGANLKNEYDEEESEETSEETSCNYAIESAQSADQSVDYYDPPPHSESIIKQERRSGKSTSNHERSASYHQSMADNAVQTVVESTAPLARSLTDVRQINVVEDSKSKDVNTH